MVTLFSNPSQLLRLAYIITCWLCAIMLIWILVLPSSAFQDSDFFIHKSELLNAARGEMLKNEYNFLPRDLITKYKGHTAVHFTHILPGALWAALVPIQLHPGIRKSNRTLHRISGYVFFLTSFLIVVGIFLIIKRGLTFENYLDDKTVKKRIITPSMILVACWFSLTAVIALLQAKRKRFDLHQTWIIRHIAAGIWVSIQRMLINLTYPILFSFQIFIDNSQIVQEHLFEKASYVAVIISFTISEICIANIRKIKRIEKKDVKFS